MSTNIPDEFNNRGPIPGSLVATFVAEEAGVEGVLVTTGTADRTVKRADIGDFPIGWSQGEMKINEEVDITLFQPMLKLDVDAASFVISYGDTLEGANNGTVRKSEGVSSKIFIALLAASASGQTLAVPVYCCPDAVTT